ncbi:MAG: hypothetical protein R2769_09090 [Saprospiraceae bacterium]
MLVQVFKPIPNSPVRFSNQADSTFQVPETIEATHTNDLNRSANRPKANSQKPMANSQQPTANN